MRRIDRSEELAGLEQRIGLVAPAGNPFATWSLSSSISGRGRSELPASLIPIRVSEVHNRERPSNRAMFSRRGSVPLAAHRGAVS